MNFAIKQQRDAMDCGPYCLAIREFGISLA